MKLDALNKMINRMKHSQIYVFAVEAEYKAKIEVERVR